MAVTGCVLVERTPGGVVLNEYGCATREVAINLAGVIHAKGLKYSLRVFEFTDAEYSGTIGYFSTLEEKDRLTKIFIETGERVGGSS